MTQDDEQNSQNSILATPNHNRGNPIILDFSVWQCKLNRDTSIIFIHKESKQQQENER